METLCTTESRERGRATRALRLAADARLCHLRRTFARRGSVLHALRRRPVGRRTRGTPAPPRTSPAAQESTEVEWLQVLEGSTFMLSDHRGDVMGGSIAGTVPRGHAAPLAVRAARSGDSRPAVLTSNSVDHFSAAFFMTNNELPGIPPHTISVQRYRYIGNGLTEVIVLTNHRGEPVIAPGPAERAAPTSPTCSRSRTCASASAASSASRTISEQLDHRLQRTTTATSARRRAIALDRAGDARRRGLRLGRADRAPRRRGRPGCRSRWA